VKTIFLAKSTASVNIKVNNELMRVRIVPSEKSGWIIGRMINELKSRNYWSVGPPSSDYEINYLLNYDQPNNLLRCFDTGGTVAAFFTHPSSPTFFKIADAIDIRICMSKKYAQIISGQFVHCGVAESYMPKLILGVNAKFRSDGRKGEDMLEKIKKIPFVKIRYLDVGLAKENEQDFLNRLETFYEEIDALLITSTVEGGPIPALEALAKGKNVIGPRNVGFLDDLPLLHYDNRDETDLIRVINQLYRDRSNLSDKVHNFTWQNFAKETETIFKNHLESKS
jgi:hypothetical protein